MEHPTEDQGLYSSERSLGAREERFQGGWSSSLVFGDFSGRRAGVYMLLWVGSRFQGYHERVGKVATVLVRSDAMSVLLFVQTLESDFPRTAVCLSKLLLGPRA